MKTTTPLSLGLALLAGLALATSIGDAQADQRQDCYTIDRSRPEWGPGPSAIEDPEIIEPVADLKPLGVIPNPFCIGTTLSFAVPAGIRQATIRIFDPMGRVLRVLEAPVATQGSHQVSWDRLDQEGRRVPPGICFYHIEVGETRSTGRLVLID